MLRSSLAALYSPRSLMPTTRRSSACRSSATARATVATSSARRSSRPDHGDRPPARRRRALPTRPLADRTGRAALIDFLDGIALGDVLADYSDGGGGLVVAVFSYSISLGGRLVTDGYLPMMLAPQSQDVTHTLVIDDPAHRIMNNVVSFNGGTSSYHHAPTSLNVGASLVASWDHGEPLVSRSGRRRTRA